MAATAATLAGLSFLVLDGSHMIYELRDTLHGDLYKQGAAYVHTIGVCGASAMDWVNPPAKAFDCGAEKIGKEAATVSGPGMQTRSIEKMIEADKPDVVVLIIADTMGAYDNPVFPKAWAWQSITALTKAIASTKTTCVWVGPAYGKEGGQYNKRDDRVERAAKFLSGSVAPCTYIDSLAFAKPGEWRTFDGQHFTPDGYAAWSKAIIGRLEKLPAIQALRANKK